MAPFYTLHIAQVASNLSISAPNFVPCGLLCRIIFVRPLPVAKNYQSVDFLFPTTITPAIFASIHHHKSTHWLLNYSRQLTLVVEPHSVIVDGTVENAKEFSNCVNLYLSTRTLTTSIFFQSQETATRKWFSLTNSSCLFKGNVCPFWDTTVERG